MKIALINENSQKKKNEFIYNVLERVASKYGHEVYNYGVSEDKDSSLDYVGLGVLTGILLNSHAVDFVITGCASGQGACISSNAMPNVYCGLISDAVDAKLFAKVNAGNAISIPFGKYFGIGSEFQLEQIFTTLFETEFASGYPSERKEIQTKQRQNLYDLKQTSHISMANILEEVDKDMLYNMIHNDYFEENFFANCKIDTIGEFLKEIIDAWEDELE